ncbi:MAG: hypothetical protein V1816_05680 [Pseudomonadota bacterium]
MTEEQKKTESGPGEAASPREQAAPNWAETPGSETRVEPQALSDATEKDDFKPFYVKEAHQGALAKGVLYFLFIALGVGLLGFGIEIFIEQAPFRLETAAALVICLALLGLLWKKISWEVRVGLEAACLGFLAALAHTVYGAGEMGLLGLPPALVPPIILGLGLAAALTAAWLLRPGRIWPPVLLSVFFLYAALAPAFAIATKSQGLEALFLGPGFMASWPIFLRPGWVLAQAALPLGALLFLILQTRTLVRKQYQTHYGHLFWAVFLLLISTVGLTALERAEEPVFPRLDPILALFYPVEKPFSPSGAAPEQTEPQPVAPAPLTPPGPAVTPANPAPSDQASPVPAPSDPRSPDQASPNQASPDPTPAPDTTSGEKVGSEAPKPPVPAGEEEETPALPAESRELLELEEKVNSLEEEIQYLRQRLIDQENLMRSLLNYFGSGEYLEPAPVPEEEPREYVPPPGRSGPGSENFT